MNKIYSLVWNQLTQSFVVASEFAKRGRIKSKRGFISYPCITFMILMGFNLPVLAQSVSLSGDLGEMNNALTQIRTLPPVNQPTWIHRTGFPHVVVGTLNTTSANNDSGPSAFGTATISDGGTAYTNRVWAGYETNAVGIINITGAGSLWNVSGLTRIGEFGRGYLNINNGGALETSGLLFGLYENAYGEGYVSGPNSRVDATLASSWLIVGREGTGFFQVDNQAVVNVAGYLRVGEYYNASGVMNILSGAQVHVQRYLDISAEQATTKGEVLVSDPGSIWTGETWMRIGRAGTGTLTIQNDGQVQVKETITFAGALAGVGRGTLNIGGAVGEQATTPGYLTVSEIIFGSGNGNLNFNHTSSNYDFSNKLTGGKNELAFINQVAGTTTLSADNSLFSGTTNVLGGTLRIDTVLGTTTSNMNIATSGTLVGTGIIGGNVQVNDGVISPGNFGTGTLMINGNLSLSDSSVLNFELGESQVSGGTYNDLINVGGDLTLDGTLNVSNSFGGNYGAGIYRVINYGGNLITMD